MIIAFEGIDASGKATQAKLLAKKLKKMNRAVEIISFPRYNSFFGKLIKRYLNGEKFNNEVVPLLYSLDRYDAKPSIERKLKRGKILIFDRYYASNLAHQGTRFKGKERKKFIEWMQLVDSRLPMPDITFFLDIEVEFSLALMEKEHRKKDKHEKNKKYLQEVRRIYLQLSKNKGWYRIKCVSRGRLRSIEEISQEIWGIVAKKLKSKHL